MRTASLEFAPIRREADGGLLFQESHLQSSAAEDRLCWLPPCKVGLREFAAVIKSSTTFASLLKDKGLSCNDLFD